MPSSSSRILKKFGTTQPSTACSTGFTLIELIIASALVMITAGVAMVWLNPSAQFASARNTRRSADINAIANAIGQKIADNRGVFTCTGGALPTNAATIMATSSGNYNIAPCLVPAYLATFPYDPAAPGASYVSVSSYDSRYTVRASSTTGIITIAAPYAELGAVITVSR
ncbi:MAG: prepilin-type N-terminal cleavage/methylation domain-containing protein [bacterium]|nr:prepilin-type N-terminal cleavage/methylation domain-containing protein [bacterium]